MDSALYCHAGMRWSDAFPKEDSAIRKELGDVTPAEAELLSQNWRPWRAYATLYLWQKVNPGENI